MLLLYEFVYIVLYREWFTFWVILLSFFLLSAPPYSSEPGRVTRRVAHRVPDVPVPQIILNQPGVRSVISQRVTTGMTQHVRMGTYRQSGFFAGIREDVVQLLAGNGVPGTLDEQPVIAGLRPLFTDAEPFSQGPDLPGDKRVDGGEAVLDARDINLVSVEVDIGETQAEQLGGPEAVKEGHQNEAVVTFGVGAVKNSGEQQADFLRGEELTFLHGE